MKKLSIVLALVAVCSVAAYAVDFAALQPQGYVSDFAGVIDASSRARLEQYCAALEKSTGVQMALVTVPTLSGEPVDDVANALFRKWGIGQKGKNDGILLLLSIQDRRSRLELGYGLEPDITDGMAGDTLRAMRPYLREQRYGDAFLEAASDIGTRISKARNVALDTPAPQPQHRRGRERGHPLRRAGGRRDPVLRSLLAHTRRAGGAARARVGPADF